MPGAAGARVPACGPAPGRPRSCYDCAVRFRTEADVDPLLAIIITAVLAFGAHVLLTLALRSK